ncbi:hypothetical protein BOTBODRAFT_49419 [Botryobasidium botryosum FD-172 SS1]|uniref:Uncharacterized protein n=1 Tax=Botryobasidium botryosum (strain FD-172 SS1) TaxID=930990 RepID=A0A067LSZ0_BOTB1|nr:hypothetical protein BOTBODRAFT_49419 [Botryobasidium botryosum FD-172 SS1]
MWQSEAGGSGNNSLQNNISILTYVCMIQKQQLLNIGHSHPNIEVAASVLRLENLKKELSKIPAFMEYAAIIHIDNSDHHQRVQNIIRSSEFLVTTAHRGSGHPPGACNCPALAIMRKGHGLYTNIHLAEDLGLAVDSEISDASFDMRTMQLFTTIGGEEPAVAPKVSKPCKTAPAPARQRKPWPMVPPKVKGGKTTGPGAKAVTMAPGGACHAQSEAHF